MLDTITKHIDIWTSAQIKKSTVGRGTRKKQEAYGVKKLRELILELAVRGKLIPQAANDEPASALLKKIKEANRHGKIKKNQNLAEIKKKEKPFSEPLGWEWCRFIEVLDFQGGSQPPKSQFSDTCLENYVQLIQIRDLGPNPQPVYVPKESVSKFCTEQDIMVGRYGASVGKVFWGKEGAYNVALIKINNELGAYFAPFLFFLLRSVFVQSYFLKISRSAQDGFNKDDIAPKLIPLPPLAEQKRIVAKVDELMAFCDQLEKEQEGNLETHQALVATLLNALTSSKNNQEFQEAWQRIADCFDLLFTTEESIDQLKQTILQLAVMGKLVPQNPNDEPASELLKKIQKEKEKLVKEGKIKEQTKHPGVAAEERLFHVPDNWQWARVGEIGHDWGQKTPKDDFTYIDVSSIDNEAGVVNDPNILTAAEAPSRARKIVKKGTIIYATVRPYLKNICVIEKDYSPEAIASTAFAILSPFQAMPGKFFVLFFRSPQFVKYVETVQTGIAYPAINDKQFFGAVIPVPPLAEQKRIVAKVDELMVLCDRLKENLQQSETTKTHLADAIVEKAVAS